MCDSNLTASVHWECRTRYLCKEKTTKRGRDIPSADQRLKHDH